MSRSAPSARPAAATSRGAGAPTGRAVTAGGVLMIGVAYGFARYGYGLFEPAIRAEFGLSVAASGLVAGAGYVGYVAGLLAVGLLVDRFGPRAMIVAAGVAAVLGLGLMVTASTPVALVLGVVVAGASPGLGWAPYSDVVDRSVEPRRRRAVLSAIPSGTAFGITVAGVLALAGVPDGWRTAWWVFCALGLVAVAVNLAVIPRTAVDRAHRTAPGRLLRDVLGRPAARRLFVASVSYGALGAVYWTFSVSAISETSPDTALGPVFWTVIGISGTTAILAGRLFARIGLRSAHVTLFTALGAACAAVGLAPWSWWAVGASAAVYGFAFMATSGLLAVWSYHLFPDRPSVGFTATVLMLGLGSIVGPALLGLLAEHSGFRTALLVVAAVGLATSAARPAR